MKDDFKIKANFKGGPEHTKQGVNQNPSDAFVGPKSNINTGLIQDLKNKKIPLHSALLKGWQRARLSDASSKIIIAFQKHQEGNRKWFSKEVLDAIEELASLICDEKVQGIPPQNLANISPIVKSAVLKLPYIFAQIAKEWNSEAYTLSLEKGFQSKLNHVNDFMHKYPVNIFKDINTLYKYFHKDISTYQTVDIKPKWDAVEAEHYKFVRHVANNHYKFGNLKLSLNLLNKIISVEPNEAKNYSQRACIYIDQDDHYSAIKDYSRVIELDPSCAKAYFLRATLERLTGFSLDDENQHIKADFKKAAELDPKYAQYYIDIYIEGEKWSRDEVYLFIKEKYGEEQVDIWHQEIENEGCEEDISPRSTIKELIARASFEANHRPKEERITRLKVLAKEIESRKEIGFGSKAKLKNIYQDMQALLAEKQQEEIDRENYELAAEIQEQLRVIHQKIKLLELSKN